MPKGTYQRASGTNFSLHPGGVYKCPCEECRAKKKVLRQAAHKREWAAIKADPEKLKARYEKGLEWRRSPSGSVSAKKSSKKTYKKSYSANREEWMRRSRQWVIDNPERVRARRKERGYDARYLENNPEARRRTHHKYFETHKEILERKFIEAMEAGGLEKYAGTKLEKRYHYLKLPPELRAAHDALAKARKVLKNKSVPS